jgi:2-methylcitrate dehydratase
MTVVARLARFVGARSWHDLSEAAREELKIRVLDALGCALGAMDAPPVRAIRAHLEEFGGRQLCTLIGGGHTAPDRAALYNGSLVRYLDFNDSYFAPGETCHPSDNLGPVLAAAEYAHGSGRELLTALAVAYQVQCRLSDEAPVRAKGFDHTTQRSYAAAAGAAKALPSARPRRRTRSRSPARP